ncbi:MAG: hypothetical protein Q4A50_07065 [Bacteroidales bacterium]|nr:hypothetical protein [Bacteroidales bacterium]
MTPNKHFNSYKEGLDLEFLREYCMEHGLRDMLVRLRGRVRFRLPLLPRRRLVGGEHRGGHAVRGARHQRTGAAGPD